MTSFGMVGIAEEEIGSEGASWEGGKSADGTNSGENDMVGSREISVTACCRNRFFKGGGGSYSLFFSLSRDG